MPFECGFQLIDLRVRLFILLLLPLCASSQVNIDSLRGLWNNKSNHDTIRLTAMGHIARTYVFSQPDSALHFASLEYNLAVEVGNKKHQANALNNKGISYLIQSDFDSALHCFEPCLEIYKEMDSDQGIANCLNNIGLIHQQKGNFPKAIECYTSSLKKREALGDKLGKANALGNIGLIYTDQGQFELAIGYFEEALEIFKELGQKQGLATTLNNIGTAFKSSGELEKAYSNFESSLEIAREIQDLYSVGNALSNIGSVYEDRGDIENAINFNNQTLEVQQMTGEKKGQASTLIKLGSLYRKRGDLNQALKYATDGYEMASQIGSIVEINDGSECLWDIYKALGKPGRALEYYERHIRLRDSIKSIENQRAIIQLEYDQHRFQDSLTYAKQKARDDLANAKRSNKEANQRYALYGGLVFMLILGSVFFAGYQRKKKDNILILVQKEEVELQKEIVEEKNKEITDSIAYAQRIQSAILPSDRVIREFLPDSFVFYQPKDIVAGDFYWLEQIDNKVLVAAADCTGHGVPGAMVSVICNNGLNRSVREHRLSEAGAILDRTREIVIQEFEKSDEEVKDGMDIALCVLSGTTLQFAGANNPLWLVRKGSDTVEEIKGDKQPIGKYRASVPFASHQLEVNPGDTFYIFSDGFADQFGGEKGKKFKTANFKRLLLSIQNQSMQDQLKALKTTFTDWKGNLEQVDDVCILGIKV